MTQVKMFNSDGTATLCPYGGSINYPIGTIKKIKVSGYNCTLCPCYRGVEYHAGNPTSSYIKCDCK